jgi:hypothetical protein
MSAAVLEVRRPAWLPLLRAAVRRGGVLAAIALPRPDVIRELPVEIVAAGRHRMLGAIFMAKRLLGSKDGFAKDSTGSTMPVIMNPPLTTREVASQAAAVLPGVRVRRLLCRPRSVTCTDGRTLV